MIDNMIANYGLYPTLAILGGVLLWIWSQYSEHRNSKLRREGMMASFEAYAKEIGAVVQREDDYQAEARGKVKDRKIHIVQGLRSGTQGSRARMTLTIEMPLASVAPDYRMAVMDWRVLWWGGDRGPGIKEKGTSTAGNWINDLVRRQVANVLDAGKDSGRLLVETGILVFDQSIIDKPPEPDVIRRRLAAMAELAATIEKAHGGRAAF
ncbi:MAG: hypothetical protein R3E94_06900 [Burkholderiaceae bacterium]